MFDPTKPVQTRDGRKARIICTDRRHKYDEIVALIDTGDSEKIKPYTKAGRYYTDGDESILDLINIPENKYLNVFEYLNGDLGAFYCDTKQEAESYAINARTCGAKVLLEAHPIEV